MVELGTQNALRAVRSLPFCYLCGGAFDTTQATNHDHVPPKTVFALADRQPLKLRTHEVCNSRHSLNDEKIGQLIALRRHEIPEKVEDRKLHLAHLGVGFGAVTNLNVDAALWRWIQGFHAALYQEPLTRVRGSIVTPFPRADQNAAGRFVLAPVYPQHQLFVEVIKAQRLRNAVDRITANSGKLTYECVWGQADAKDAWLCMFGLNIYDWKIWEKIRWLRPGVVQVVTPYPGLRSRQPERRIGRLLPQILTQWTRLLHSCRWSENHDILASGFRLKRF